MEFVLIVPLIGHVIPKNFAVRAELAANPEPDTVTVEPALPLVGLREIDEVTVNVAIAVFELASVTLTVLAPAT